MFWCGPVLGQQQDYMEQYRLAESAFQYQDYQKTVNLMRPLLYPSLKLVDRQVQLKAREYLGTASWWLDDKGSFNQEMTWYLIMEPGAELDPFFYPPEMVKDFQDLKLQLLDMNVIKPADSSPENVDPGEAGQVQIVEKLRIERSPVVAFVPFGVGQFVNDQPGKGAFFLTSEAVCLAANIGSWLFMSRSGGGGDLRTAAIGTMYGSFGLLLVLATWGVVDARLNFREFEIREERTIGPLQPGPDAGPMGGIPGTGFSLGWGFGF